MKNGLLMAAFIGLLLFALYALSVHRNQPDPLTDRKTVWRDKSLYDSRGGVILTLISDQPCRLLKSDLGLINLQTDQGCKIVSGTDYVFTVEHFGDPIESQNKLRTSTDAYVTANQDGLYKIHVQGLPGKGLGSHILDVWIGEMFRK